MDLNSIVFWSIYKTLLSMEAGGSGRTGSKAVVLCMLPGAHWARMDAALTLTMQGWRGSLFPPKELWNLPSCSPEQTLFFRKSCQRSWSSLKKLFQQQLTSPAEHIGSGFGWLFTCSRAVLPKEPSCPWPARRSHSTSQSTNTMGTRKGKMLPSSKGRAGLAGFPSLLKLWDIT